MKQTQTENRIPREYLLDWIRDLERSRGSIETEVSHLVKGQDHLAKDVGKLSNRVNWLFAAVIGAGFLPEIPWVSQKVNAMAAAFTEAVSSLFLS